MGKTRKKSIHLIKNHCKWIKMKKRNTWNHDGIIYTFFLFNLVFLTFKPDSYEHHLKLNVQLLKTGAVWAPKKPLNVFIFRNGVEVQIFFPFGVSSMFIVDKRWSTSSSSSLNTLLMAKSNVCTLETWRRSSCRFSTDGVREEVAKTGFEDDGWDFFMVDSERASDILRFVPNCVRL